MTDIQPPEAPEPVPPQPAASREPSSGAYIPAPDDTPAQVTFDAPKPSIGRIVWATNQHGETFPAVVTGAWQNPQDAELDDQWCAHLTVLGLRTTTHLLNVPYSATPVERSWRWPEILS